MRAGKTYGGKGAEGHRGIGRGSCGAQRYGGHRGIGRSRAGRKGTEGIAASGGGRAGRKGTEGIAASGGGRAGRKGTEGIAASGGGRAGRKGTEGIAASGGARKADGTPLLSCNKKISAKRAALRKSFKKGMRSENLSDRFLQPKVNGWNCCNCKFFRASRPK